MNNSMKNVPNLKNSRTVTQGEIQSAKETMNSSNMMGQEMTSSMTLSGTASLTNSTAVDQREVQKARQKVQDSGSQNMNYNSLS